MVIYLVELFGGYFVKQSNGYIAICVIKGFTSSQVSFGVIIYLYFTMYLFNHLFQGFMFKWSFFLLSILYLSFI